MSIVNLAPMRRSRLFAGSLGLLLLLALTIPVVVMASLSAVAPGTQSPNPVAPGATTTYNVQVTNGSGTTRPVKVTAISVPGVSGVSILSSDCDLIASGSTMTVTTVVQTTGATAPGTHAMSMTATRYNNTKGKCSGAISDTLAGAGQLIVGLIPQTITFGPLADKVFGDADFTVSATASSGLTVSFSSLTTGVCTVSDTTVSIVAAGTCTIQATQPGNGTYEAATPVDQSFDIAKADATINVTGYTGVYDGAAHGATGTATGALSEDLSSLLDLGASFTYIPGGTANWTFAGNANYNSDAGSVAIDITTSGTTPFTDIDTSIFKLDIVWLNESGITSGCSPTLFCPADPVTRGQMAAFLDRALHLPATSTDYFTDDNGSLFETDINRLAAAGITTGCTPTTYCPDELVTRGQMAAFLHRAFGP